MKTQESNTSVHDRLSTLQSQGMDRSFLATMELLKTYSTDQAYSHILSKFLSLPLEYRDIIENYYNLYPFWGTCKIKEQDFSVFKSKADSLTNHVDDLMWLYTRLADHRSRFVLKAVIENWLNFDFNSLGDARELVFEDYFDPDIMHCDENEVLVDLGACNGDTVKSYLNVYGTSYKKIFCYEITPSAFALMKQYLLTEHNLKNIELRLKGAGDKHQTLYIKEHPQSLTANTLVTKGDIPVEIVSIDEDISEPVTFIKMDIEGAEQAAIRGCREHIKNNKPKLAISVYHNNVDIWKIPRMIEEICPGYNFYLRYHGGSIIPTELSFLAVYK